MAPVLTEGRHATEGLLSEAEFNRSRDNATIAAGSGVIIPGQVLGQITASKKYGPSTNAAADPATGVEIAVAIALYGCDATDTDQKIAIIRRDAQWKIGDLVFHSSVDNDTKKAAKVAQLAAPGVGIIAR